MLARVDMRVLGCLVRAVNNTIRARPRLVNSFLDDLANLARLLSSHRLRDMALNRERYHLDLSCWGWVDSGVHHSGSCSSSSRSAWAVIAP